MTKHKLLILLFLLIGISPVHAQIFTPSATFTDDFSGYENQYLILSDMNVTTKWLSAFDGNTFTQDTNRANTMVRDYTIKVKCNVALSGSNACGMQTTGQQPHFDLTDWNTADSKIWIAVRVDSNSNFSNFEIQLGTSFATSWTFRNTNPNNTGLTAGWNTVSFDLNSPVSTSGSPNIADVNYILFREVYGAPQADYNMYVNGIWLQKPPNEFNNVWQNLQIPFAGIYVPQGYSLPFNSPTQGFGMSMANNGKESFGYHGRIFLPTYYGLDLREYNKSFQFDLNQVDINVLSRVILEAENFSPGDSFSGCYIKVLGETSREVGVEEWEAGVQTTVSKNITMNFGDYNTVLCRIVDNNLSLFINGNIQASNGLVERKIGYIGLEVFGGRQNIKNVSITLLNTDTTSASGLSLLAKPEWLAIRDFFLPLILFLLMLGMIYGGITTGAPQLALLGIILVYIIYILLTALFFS